MNYKYKNINDLKKEEYEIYYNILPQNDKNKIKLSIKEDYTKQQILARYILKNMLFELYNIDYDKLEIKLNNYGKPFINNKIYFNISHSHNFVIVTVSNNTVGVDIEKIRDVNLNIAKQFATDMEYEYIINSKNKYVAFFSIYVLKEAYFKMLGKNLADMKNVFFSITDNNVSCNDKTVKIKLSYEIEGYVFAIIYK